MSSFLFRIFLLLMPFTEISAAMLYPRRSLYIKYSEEMEATFIKKMQKERGYSLLGEGGGFLYDINLIEISFISHKELLIEEARREIVTSVDSLLSEINADKKMRPYLDQFPFQLKNVRISLGFYDEKGIFPDKRYVSHVFTGRDDRLVYAYYDVEKKKLEPLYEETYEEALEKLKNEAGLLVEGE